MKIYVISNEKQKSFLTERGTVTKDVFIARRFDDYYKACEAVKLYNAKEHNRVVRITMNYETMRVVKPNSTFYM
jgi:hypothetical protein